MKALARTVLEAFEFFELCDDETLDPDDALKMMESLSFELRGCSEVEKVALNVACQERIDFLSSNQASLSSEQKIERIEFYENFVANFIGDDLEEEFIK